MTQINKNQIKLPGGTTGQVIAKASNDDFDFDWFDVSSLLTGTANSIAYFDDDGNLFTDSLFTRDSNTLNTRILSTYNTIDDEYTVGAMFGEVALNEIDTIPGSGFIFNNVDNSTSSLFGVIDSSSLGGSPGSAALFSSNTTRQSLFLGLPDALRFGNSSMDGNGPTAAISILDNGFINISSVDDDNSPTQGSSITFNYTIGIGIQDSVSGDYWIIDKTPGTESGQVFTFDAGDLKGYWANAAITYDAITGNLFSADTTNEPARSSAITLGSLAGQGAVNANGMIALGENAGVDATGAVDSIFIGSNTGVDGTQLYNTIAIGLNAGNNAPLASNSIFIGRNAGLNDTVDNFNTVAYSILIGDSTSTGGNSNSVAIGTGAANSYPNEFLVQSPTYPFKYGRFDFNETIQLGDVGNIYTGAGLELSMNPGSILGYTRAQFNFDRAVFNGRISEQGSVVNLDNGDNADLDTFGIISNYVIFPDSTSGGTIATGTITLPAVPQNGDKITIVISGTITSLTIDPGSTAVIGTLPTSVTTYDVVSLIYLIDANAWVVTSK